MKRRRAILLTISADRGLTDFEKSVYKAVLAIPKGEVHTYRWVAERIGRPKAYRAVGNALNKNPYAPDVPCHRVVRTDGSIGGYSKGSASKRRLLDSERVDWRRAY